MKTYDLLLTAGKETRVTIDYNFFLVLADGGFSFDVALFKGSGFQNCEGVSAGFGVRLNEYRGKEFIFTSANTQTIKVFVGNDEAIYQRLSGTVTINGGTLASIASITALTDILNTVKVRDDGVNVGATYQISTGAVAANTPSTVFTPAANVNGAILWLAAFYSYHANTLTKPSFLTKASAPTSPVDGDVLVSASSGGMAATMSGTLARPVRIPAGKGLYYIAGSAEDNGFKSAAYTLL